jgi:AcrR family transcriptional regulator
VLWTTPVTLLIEHDGTVSTSEIAAAAGIAEGTVFRAFKDKQDLLIACMRAGLNPDEEIARIEGIGSRNLALAMPVGNGVAAALAASVGLMVVGVVASVRGFRRPLPL